MTPLEQKLAEVLRAQIQARVGDGFEMDYGALAVLVKKTIREELAASMRAGAAAAAALRAQAVLLRAARLRHRSGDGGETRI